jgi:hypothetical protein
MKTTASRGVGMETGLRATSTCTRLIEMLPVASRTPIARRE